MVQPEEELTDELVDPPAPPIPTRVVIDPPMRYSRAARAKASVVANVTAAVVMLGILAAGLAYHAWGAP